MSRRMWLAVAATLVVVCTAAPPHSQCVPPGPGARAYECGDIFAALGGGSVEWRRKDGSLVAHIDTSGVDGQVPSPFATGMAFDTAGNLFGTLWGRHRIYMVCNGQTTYAFQRQVTFADAPESIVFDLDSNFYVGFALPSAAGNFSFLNYSSDNYAEIRNFARVDVGSSRSVDWVELDSTGCILHYTSENNCIYRYDVCQGVQLTPLTCSLRGSFALRINPNMTFMNELIVADGADGIKVLSLLDGSLLRQFTMVNEAGETGTDEYFALNLGEGGSTVYTARRGGNRIYQYDVATGAHLRTIPLSLPTGTTTGIFGLAVRCEATAGQGCSNGKKDPRETDIDCGGRCGPCSCGKTCRADSDCASGHCDGAGVCTSSLTAVIAAPSSAMPGVAFAVHGGMSTSNSLVASFSYSWGADADCVVASPNSETTMVTCSFATQSSITITLSVSDGCTLASTEWTVSTMPMDCCFGQTCGPSTHTNPECVGVTCGMCPDGTTCSDGTCCAAVAVNTECLSGPVTPTTSAKCLCVSLIDNVPCPDCCPIGSCGPSTVFGCGGVVCNRCDPLLDCCGAGSSCGPQTSGICAQLGINCPCPLGLSCSNGQCTSCPLDCTNRVCGRDANNCGQCGQCEEEDMCVDGQCVAPTP